MDKETFVSFALSFIGSPASCYKGESRGITPSRFDCSGFVNFLLTQAGYPQPIPRHANELFDSFGVIIHEQFISPGDLIFFSNRGGIYPDHVGILVSKDEYIHSPGRNGRVVCTCKLTHETIVSQDKANQIYFSNPIGFKRITVKNGRYQQPFLNVSTHLSL